MTTKERYARIIEYFLASEPHPEPELHFSDPFSLLVAVMLSAQCTDRRVNAVMPALMAAYPTAEVMACADEADLLRYIASVSYPNAKARHLAATARLLVERHGGQVPMTRDELTALPGVGRKTANVVLAVLLHAPVIPVDTHIYRVAERLGLTRNSPSPLATELTLTRNIKSQLRADAHHWLLLHGRYICTARSPHCHECPLADFCLYHDRKSKETTQAK